MGIKLGDISPVAGIATGKGMFGKIADQAGYGLGVIPGLLAEQRRKERNQKTDAEAAAAEEAAKPQELVRNTKPMKKGGAVKSSASKRADGCAVRGKTKGRMV